MVLFFLALTAAAVMQRVAPLESGMPSFALGMALGWGVWAVAALLAGAALHAMMRRGTPVEPGQRPTALVTSGVFNLSRNPIYLALVLATGGVALMTNALWFLLAAAVLWLLLDRIVVRSEERLIEETFGDEYRAYTRRTRRWL